MLKDFFRYFRGRNEEERALFNTLNWDNIYYSFLSNICNGIFNFENLTKSEEDLLITSIFKYNFICYYNNNNIPIFCGATPLGQPNDNGEYTSYTLHLNTGSKTVNAFDKNLIIGKLNTIVGVTYDDLCNEFASLLTETKKSILNSIILSRMSKVFECENANDVESLKKELDTTLDVGKPYIIHKGTFNKSTSVTSINVEDTTKYFDVIREVLNEFLSIIGLTSLVAPNKKERLITDEIKSNDDIKGTILARQLDNLENFINEINSQYNKNIMVSINEKIDETINNTINDLGGANND